MCDYTLMTTQQKLDRLHAGVVTYAQLGYYQPDYQPKDTDVLAAFRFVPQPGVAPEEAGAPLGGERSPALRSVVGAVRLDALEHCQADVYRLAPLPGAAG